MNDDGAVASFPAWGFSKTQVEMWQKKIQLFWEIW
jgi:hypothetical protein